jgi:ankyrin repeat protein
MFILRPLDRSDNNRHNFVSSSSFDRFEIALDLLTREFFVNSAISTECCSRALLRTARGGHLRLAQLLIRHGAKASFDASEGLMAAVSHGSAEIVELLLSQKKSAAKADARNSIALELAAFTGNVEIGLMLLRQSKNPGWTLIFLKYIYI